MKIKITSENNYAVLGLDGAMLNSLNKNGTEYLWQGDSKYWAGQAPVCFPITGVLPNGEMEAFGKKCTMKRHGVARINPFEVDEQCKNSVTFVQHSNENTKREFPFDYELKIKYTIGGDTVTNEYIIKNTGDCDLPFVIGGHPAFNCPIDSDEKFEDYKVVFDKNIIQTRLIDGSYPDTARLIPLEFDYELDINRADLLNAIDRVSLLLNEQNNIVKLDMSNEQVILSSYQQEIGSVEENLASSFYKGEPLTISFSCKYASDAIKSFSGDKIKILFTGEMKPFIVKDFDSDELLQLVLPVRTY